MIDKKIFLPATNSFPQLEIWFLSYFPSLVERQFGTEFYRHT